MQLFPSPLPPEEEEAAMSCLPFRALPPLPPPLSGPRHKHKTVGLSRQEYLLQQGSGSWSLLDSSAEGKSPVRPLPALPPALLSLDFLIQARLLSGRRTAAAPSASTRSGLALLLHLQPDLSNVEAAHEVELHPNSVRLWRQRWAKGEFVLEDRPGRGRKAAFSPLWTAAQIKALACEQVARTETPLSRRVAGRPLSPGLCRSGQAGQSPHGRTRPR